MDRTIRVYGGFRLSPSLASKVGEAVEELRRQTFSRDLSHSGDDCPFCCEMSDESPVDSDFPFHLH